MRRQTLLLVSFVALISYACGSDDERARPSPESDAGADALAPDGAVRPNTNALWTSGSRLRAELEVVGGATGFRAFFDTARNERCWFRRTIDGFRCLPESVPVLYDDAACQIPAAAARTQCAEDASPGYAVVYRASPDVCSPAQTAVEQLFAFGDAIAARDGFDRRADGTCDPRAAAAFDYVALGGQVALDSFVRASVEREDVSATIARGRFVGEDGSSVIDSLVYDRARDGRPCNFARVGAGPEGTRPWRCVTGRQAIAQDSIATFADPACTQRTSVVYDDPSCSAPEIVVRTERVDPDGGACSGGGAVVLHTAGAPAASAYESNIGGCVPKPPIGSERYFALGPPLDTTSIPVFEELVFGEATRGRLRSFASGGAPIDFGTFWDESEQARCHVGLFDDGKRYCVSDRMPVRGRSFKDPSCTQPVVLTSSCDAAPTFAIALADAPCRPYSATGFAVGTSPLAITEVWRQDAEGTCSSAPQPISAPLVAYDVLGPTPVGTKLMEATLVRE